MVGDHDDQAVVEGAEGLQPVEDPSEHAVGVCDLRQVLALHVRGRDAIGGTRPVLGPECRAGLYQYLRPDGRCCHGECGDDEVREVQPPLG